MDESIKIGFSLPFFSFSSSSSSSLQTQKKETFPSVNISSFFLFSLIHFPISPNPTNGTFFGSLFSASNNRWWSEIEELHEEAKNHAKFSCYVVLTPNRTVKKWKKSLVVTRHIWAISQSTLIHAVAQFDYWFLTATRPLILPFYCFYVCRAHSLGIEMVPMLPRTLFFSSPPPKF